MVVKKKLFVSIRIHAGGTGKCSVGNAWSVLGNQKPFLLLEWLDRGNSIL